MLSLQLEQRVNLKFLVKLGKTFTDAYAMLKEVYGNECLSRTLVFEWFKRFKEGREMTEDHPRPGRPSTLKTDENIEKNWDSLTRSFKNKRAPPRWAGYWRNDSMPIRETLVTR
ncbi:hypothetical protein NQ318_017651 [Aromia moschata]|uniref:Mos1 transposase HTH domain-containing protein n=1 Tax=Aromia moschata TaxID=1265417 RepID=A0AAV8Z145_9CUCU|nr:hypothetical protein NQ318_017651 [Aromia moschata]